MDETNEPTPQPIQYRNPADEPRWQISTPGYAVLGALMVVIMLAIAQFGVLLIVFGTGSDQGPAIALLLFVAMAGASAAVRLRSNKNAFTLGALIGFGLFLLSNGICFAAMK